MLCDAYPCNLQEANLVASSVAFGLNQDIVENGATSGVNAFLFQVISVFP